MLAAAVACYPVEVENGLSGIDSVSGGRMITETISGSHGVSTKATISNDNASFQWTAGDNLAVHVSNGDSHKYVFTSGEGGASVSSPTADFVVSYEEGYDRDAFAVFPSTIVAADAANYGQSGHSLDVTLPASYTLAQVSGETTPCPMIASNTSGSGWLFYQLCGLLRLTVNSIPPSTKRLEIDFDGKKVWGDFSIASPVPGTSVIATTDDGEHDVITITKDGTGVTLNNNAWLDGQVLNIPLPTGKYTNITVTAYNALTGGDAVLTMTRAFAYTASSKNGTKRTASFPVFSVSASKRVIFAPGNLQATTTDLGANWTWHFAEHQYDYIGNAAANNKMNGNGVATVSDNGTVDLFGNSKERENPCYGISSSTTGNYDAVFNGTFRDWGKYLDIRKNDTPPYTYYDKEYWYTMSEAEWKYVLGESDSTNPYKARARGGTVGGVSNALCTKATVNNVHGFLIFPDFFTEGSTSITWDTDCISPGRMTNSGTDGWGTTINATEWNTLEENGCVFLPAAGNIKGWNSNAAVAEVGSIGRYRSSDRAALRFDNDGFDPNQSGTNFYKFSVRLAHEVN